MTLRFFSHCVDVVTTGGEKAMRARQGRKGLSSFGGQEDSSWMLPDSRALKARELGVGGYIVHWDTAWRVGSAYKSLHLRVCNLHDYFWSDDSKWSALVVEL